MVGEIDRRSKKLKDIEKIKIENIEKRKLEEAEEEEEEEEEGEGEEEFGPSTHALAYLLVSNPKHELGSTFRHLLKNRT